MHAKYWSFFLAPREKFFTLDSTRNNITYNWILLGQISCEIHFFPITKVLAQPVSLCIMCNLIEGYLPLVSFLKGKPREPEIRAYSVTLDEIYHSIYQINYYPKVDITYFLGPCKCTLDEFWD